MVNITRSAHARLVRKSEAHDDYLVAARMMSDRAARTRHFSPGRGDPWSAGYLQALHDFSDAIVAVAHRRQEGP